MISIEELEGLLNDLESARVERTISLDNTDKFGEAICAFANDLPEYSQPGYLIIGAKDDGKRNGLKVTDTLLRNLAAIRSDGNIVPPPVLAVEKFIFDDGDLAVVEVQPHYQPPVRFKGKVWIRIGPRRAVATEADERRLSEKRSSFARTFDSQPNYESSLEDLSLDLFKISYLPSAVDKETIKENKRDIEDQLASLKFLDYKSKKPTNAGILIFGKNPCFFLSGAYIQYVHFDGMEMTDETTFEKQFSGDLITQLRVLDDFVQAQIIKETPVTKTFLKEEKRINYPWRAIRELLLNAIIHRDYQSNAPIKFYEFSNRIELINPGGLYGNATPENFPDVNDYRNPVIAEVVKNLGYVNKFNVGVKIAKKLLNDNGNPEPEFIKDQQLYFGVKIFRL